MGVEYTLARHDDKKLYDLGKSGWSAVVGDANDYKEYSASWLPRDKEELWARTWNDIRLDCTTKTPLRLGSGSTSLKDPCQRKSSM